jgi:hypothetical protein
MAEPVRQATLHRRVTFLFLVSSKINSFGTSTDSGGTNFAPVADTSSITHRPNIDPSTLSIMADWRSALRTFFRFSLFIDDVRSNGLRVME